MCESYFRCGKFEYIYYLGDRPKMVLSDADSGQTAIRVLQICTFFHGDIEWGRQQMDG